MTMQQESSTESRPRAKIGRPSRAESARRQQLLLDIALDMFLERGFDDTKVEDIATAASMSKRTVYARYPTKDDLFMAAVERAKQSYIIPLEALRSAESDDLKETLTRIAHVRLQNFSTSRGQKLHRVVNTQSFRFPELAMDAYREGTQPAIEHLTGVFERFAQRGDIQVSDYRKTAVAFLSLVLGPLTRIVSIGNRLPQKEIDDNIEFSVDLFLNGVRRR